MASVIRAVGPCRLPRRHGRFATLVHAIISQQVSTASARAVQRKLRRAAGGYLSPERIGALSGRQLAGAGLSRAKAGYIAGLSRAVAEGELRLDNIHRLDDGDVSARLTAIKGIGPWTADMFLMFVLNRPDVMPTGDLGIAYGFRRVYGLRKVPDERRMLRLSEPWRPYRTVGSWYLWRSLDLPDAG